MFRFLAHIATRIGIYRSKRLSARLAKQGYTIIGKGIVLCVHCGAQAHHSNAISHHPNCSPPNPGWFEQEDYDDYEDERYTS